MTTYLYFVHALSPLHAGTGQGSGVIDLPIAREKSTGLPYLPGSSVKGVLRDRSADDSVSLALFGPKTDNASEHAGSLQVADARLLLLPVRSLRGTFAWVTSPFVLQRFARDVADAKAEKLPAVPVIQDEQIGITQKTQLKVRSNLVVLEDLDLQPLDGAADAWATWLQGRIFPSTDSVWPTLLAERLALVSDNVLNFLLSTALEVIARNRLDDATKTVVKGALWYEEALPAESLLYGVASITPTQKARDLHKHDDEVLKERLNAVAAQSMQVGGKATVGRGLCRMRLV